MNRYTALFLSFAILSGYLFKDTTVKPVRPFSAQITQNVQLSYPQKQNDNGKKDCQPLIEALKSNPDWQEQLYDPIISTRRELDERIELYKEIFECLTQQGLPDTPEQEMIWRLTGYFLIFTNGLDTPPGSSTLTLVDLAKVDDPAVNRIRKQTGVPPPPGYVFVRTYASVEDMPPPIRRIFEQGDIAGLTMFTRYIAILDEEKNTWPERSLQAQTLPKTVSHELIHAYVNSNLGFESITKMPLWFHEGVAIYFSHSGENRAVITPAFTLYITPPPDYVQYDLNFKYLEAQLGQDKLLASIRQAIVQADVSPLFKNLDIDSNELPLRAIQWKNERDRIMTMISATILVVAAYLFISGQISRIPVQKIGINCEVCGRIYLFGNKSTVYQYSPPVRVWMKEDPYSETPYSIHAHRVCKYCSQRSRKIWNAYKQQMQHEIAEARIAATRIYLKWLGSAPLLEKYQEIDYSLLGPQEALAAFVNASLITRFSPSWIEGEIMFEFAEKIVNAESNLINSPPDGYANIIVQPPFSDTQGEPAYGSVFRTKSGHILINWHQRKSTQQL